MISGSCGVSNKRSEMHVWTWRRIRTVSRLLTCALIILPVITGCVSIEGHRDLEALGLEYHLKELKDPRPNRVHVLRVDLTNQAIRPKVMIGVDPDGEGPAETSLTDPRKLADDPMVLAFINTNPWDSFADSSGKKNRKWFEGQPVDISGLAVSGYVARSPSPVHSASVWVSERGRGFIGKAPGVESAVEVMTGFQSIVSEGSLAVGRSDDRHPRTAIGVAHEGTVMWLVVVDGRQERYSEGMSVYELGEIMLELGCWNAVNMDGGGSSIMGLVDATGRIRVVNSPSDRHRDAPKIRPLPMILTIREK